MASCQKHLITHHLSTTLSETTSLEQYPPLSCADPQLPQALYEMSLLTPRYNPPSTKPLT